MIGNPTVVGLFPKLKSEYLTDISRREKPVSAVQLLSSG